MGDAIEIRGPAAAQLKGRDEYRFQLWYFAPSASQVIQRIVSLRRRF